jgi:hypothetical protein
MSWEIISLHGVKYKVLNPDNWEELKEGLHNNTLTCNDTTLVIKKIKEPNTEALFLSLITD